MRRRGFAWGVGLMVLSGLVAVGRAERHAVLIGVDSQGCQHTPNSQGCPKKLYGPMNDIESLQRLLVERHQFRPEHMTIFTNNDATKTKILATLTALCQTTAAHDFLLIYFSGHGTSRFDRDLKLDIAPASGALVPADFRFYPTDVPRTMEGLIGAADTNHDRTITYQELYQFVRREVSHKHGHTPQLLGQTDLDRPVFEAPTGLITPAPSIGTPTGPLQVKIDAQPQADLHRQVSALGDVTLTNSTHDLLVTQEGTSYALYLPNGNKFCSLSTVEEVVSRITRDARIRAFVQLRNPSQTFNVWLQIGAEAGKTVFTEGDKLNLTVTAERAASLLVLNIDPHGFVNAIESRVVPGAVLTLPNAGIVEPPLGTEYFKLFAFARTVPWLAQWTYRLLDPATGEVQALLERIKQEQEWAETVHEVVTLKRP